jgi:two-component system invasion response regulator UvrY
MRHDGHDFHSAPGAGERVIRVLIADDHAIVRRGLAQILLDAGDIDVAGEAVDYAGVMALLRDTTVDVVLLDISMPGRSGLEILKILRERHPKLPVLILSMFPEDQYALRALKLGAAGYLTKDSAPQLLVDAIRAAAQGKRYVSAELALMLAEHISGPDDRAPHERLSDREFETLRLIAAGKKLSDIAEALHLSPKTVSVYRARLLEKMRLKSNAELTHYAVKNGLID